MALPQLTPEERAANLAKAAVARQQRSELRAQIKSGALTLTDILAKAGDPVVGRMKVSALLESLPGFGKAKAAKLMDSLEISPSRRIQGLGSRQIEELRKVLG